MGAPISLSRAAQAPAGLAHFLEMVKVLGQVRRTERFDPDAKRADRSVWSHHPLELADEPDCLQGRAGAGSGVHDGLEAE